MATNSIVAIISTLSLLIIPGLIIHALNKFWCPSAIKANQFKYRPDIYKEDKKAVKVEMSANWPIECATKYQDARREMDKYEKRFGHLIEDLIKESSNPRTVKFKALSYISFNFSRRLLIAFFITQLTTMNWL